MDFTKIAQINLIEGAGGGDPRAGLCIMEMVSYFDGASKVTDRPECACPLLTDIAISINDRAPTQEDRDALKPLLPLLAGSRDEDARKARAWFVMRESAVRILAVRCDKIGKSDLADAMRAATDPASMLAAVKAVCETLRADADTYVYAYAGAYVYAYTDADADAEHFHADSGAYAYAYTDADAEHFHADADTYTDAEKRAEVILADRRWAHSVMREILREAILLGKHGGLDVETYERRADELARVLA